MAVHGIIRFIYDHQYVEEGNHGTVRGAARDPQLVQLIRSLGTPSPAASAGPGS